MAKNTEVPVAQSPADLESQDCIAYLAKVTSAVGDCVNVKFELTTNAKGKQVVVNGAAKYEITSVVLAHLSLVQSQFNDDLDEVACAKLQQEVEQHRLRAEARIAGIMAQSHCKQTDWGGWPTDALEQAKQYSDCLPSVVRLFEQNATPTKCDAWEQVANDLANSGKYKNWVRRRLWYRFRELRTVEDGQEREQHLRALLLVRVHRIAVGKSAEWEAKSTDERTWLDFCLGHSRSEATRADKEERTGNPGQTTVKTHTFSNLPANAGFHHDNMESGYPSPDDEECDDMASSPKKGKIAGKAERAKLKQAVDTLEGLEKDLITLLLKAELSLDSIAERLNLDLEKFGALRDSALAKLRDQLNA
jgi:DNA-directed RNA polymerase specialized sigma24 family protein